MITAEMKKRFAITADKLAPDDLIRALLVSPVQLIWNGGIGTYVKASGQSDEEVGDRGNDHLRVTADQLQANVFGEGGNLGMTQGARIEFALAGGAVNTDSIDNSAGVDCSDHEVNIKIALGEIVAREDMTNKQRNALLEEMTSSVAELVLANNRRQARTLSLATRHSSRRTPEYQRFIARMETEVGLDRMLEVLPTDDELAERLGKGHGLTRPELAVLLAYSKIFLKSTLVESNIHEDPAAASVLSNAFPRALCERHADAVTGHRLRREIVASQLANGIVDHMGITFVVHLLEFVGGSVEDVARAYLAFAQGFGIRAWFEAIDTMTCVEEQVRLEMQLDLMRLGRRASRWILRHHKDVDVAQFVAASRSCIEELIARRGTLMGDIHARDWRPEVDRLVGAGVPAKLAERTARASRLAEALPIIDAAEHTGAPTIRVAEVFVAFAHELRIDWLTDQLGSLTASTHWQAMERDALIDDVTTHQGLLSARALEESAGDVGGWLAKHDRFRDVWDRTIEAAQHAAVTDFSMYAITCRRLNDLCRAL